MPIPSEPARPRQGLSGSRWASNILPGSRWPSGSKTFCVPRPDSKFAPSNAPIRCDDIANHPTPSQEPSRRSPSSNEFNLANEAKSAADEELSRFLKIVARLKWKVNFLGEGYRVACDRQRAPEEISMNEMQFKIDFYEYYMLIERALVHLMAVFAIHVTGRLGNDAPSSQRFGANAHGDGWRIATHSYHANVLSALENPINPLHEALGKGEVLGELCRAKDLRNRWKRADDVAVTNALPPLESYDLERMLLTIFHGFDLGFGIARDYVHGPSQQGDVDMTPVVDDSAQAQDDWDFMVDAMVWEAI